jgi:hypothetical protein
MDWKEQSAAAKSVPQSSVQSCGDSGSAISSTHAFRAAAPTHALPAVTSDPGHRRASSAAPRLAAVTVPQHGGSKAEARLQPAAAAQNRHCRDAEDTTAAQQRPCQQLQQQQQALLRHTAAPAAAPAAALLAGAIEAGMCHACRSPKAASPAAAMGTKALAVSGISGVRPSRRCWCAQAGSGMPDRAPARAPT